MLILSLKIKPLLEEHGATVYLTRPTYRFVPLSTRTALANIWSLEALKISTGQQQIDEELLINEMAEIDRLIGVMRSVIENPREYADVYFNTPFSPTKPMHPDLKRIFELQSNPIIGESFLFISLHSNATPLPTDRSVHGADVYHVSNQHRRLSRYYSNYSFVDDSARFGRILLDHIHDVGIQRRTVAHANFFVVREQNLPAVLVENGHHTNLRDRANLMNDLFQDNLALAYLNAIIIYFNGTQASPITLNNFDPIDTKLPGLMPY